MKKVIVYLLSAFLVCFCQLSVSATSTSDEASMPSTSTSTDQSTNSATGTTSTTDTTSTNGTTSSTDTTSTTGATTDMTGNTNTSTTTGTSDTTNLTGTTGTTTTTGTTSVNDRVTITGVPQANYTAVEYRDNAYVLPDTVVPVSGYYFINVDSSDRVCSLHKIKKISKKATPKKVTVTIKTKKEVLYCYDKEYFNFQ